MNHIIPVTYEGKPCYEIYLEESFGLLPTLLRELGYGPERKLCIVTDSNVAPLYARELQELLRHTFSHCSVHVIPAGEDHKNTDTVGTVYEHLIREKFDRRDLLLALGGGVVGDLTGFAAATYLRGIDFVQIPTTLLAQVDSSIGGKTGVDFLQYKNMVGAFYMPRLVYMNLSTLLSLPGRQYLSGMAEILKHGQIRDAAYFQKTADQAKAVLGRELSVLREIIYASCIIKRDVVERDPREQGERALLNFGHTIGHAVEKLSGFSLLHGECVSLGMVGAAFLSWRYGSYREESYRKLRKTLADFQLPVALTAPAFSPEEVLAATKLDKKMDSGRVKFVLLKEPGEAYLTREVSDRQILEGIRVLFQEEAK